MVHKNSASYLFKRGDTYYFSKQIPVDIRHNYTRSRIVICLKTACERSAIKASHSVLQRLDEYWMQLRIKDLDIPASHLLVNSRSPTHFTSNSPTLSEALETYCRLKGINRSPTFFKSAERNIKSVIKQFGDKPIESYSSSEASAFRDQLIYRGLSPSSVSRIFSSVRAVINLSISESGLNCSNAFTRTFLPEVKERKRKPILIEDIYRIQKECLKINDEKRLLIALISDTGMRLSEAAGLAWSDVNLTHEFPHINLVPHPWRSLKTVGSERQIPLVGAGLESIKIMHKQYVKTQFLFNTYTNRNGCNGNSASAALNKWLKLRVPYGVIHSFRHSMRDRLRHANINSEIIDEICGWSMQSVGQKYGIGHTLEQKHKALNSILYTHMNC